MLYAFEYAVKLKPGADQTPPVMDDMCLVELHGRGPGYRIKRLPGRVGDQMKVDPLAIHAGRIAWIAGIASPPRQVAGPVRDSDVYCLM